MLATRGLTTFSLSKGKLAFIIVLTTLCFHCPTAANQCKDIVGPFKFLVQWDLKAGYILSVHEYDRVTVNCSTNLCDATVLLMLGDKIISRSTPFNTTLERAGNRLSFTANITHHSEKIWCEARAQDKVLKSKKALLIIKKGRRIEAVTLSPNITEKTLEKGDNFSVTCQAPGHGTPGISYIKWYKQSSTGKHELHKPMVVRKGRSDTDIEILTIKNAMKGVEGTYICERQVLRGPITAAEFKLMFQEPKAPVVIVSNSSLKFRENENSIRIVCSATVGSPKPSLGWYKDGRQLEECSKTMTCILNIQTPKYPDDDGTYTCKVANSEGANSTSVSIQIMVPPTFAKTGSLNAEYASLVNSDQDAEVECTVQRANPLPKFTWYRLIANQWSEDFEKIRVIPNASVSTSTSTLIIPPSKKTAFFRCRASNEAGDGTRNVTVHWRGKGITDTASQRKILVLVITSSMVLILFVLIFAYCYKRRLHKRYGPYLQPNLQFEFDSNLSLHEQCHKMPYDPKWEFPRDKLFLLESIGKGAFGEVWLAKAQGILEFKAKATCMSPTKKKRFSRMFSFHSDYSNAEALKDTELSMVAVKTLKAGATESEFKDLASELKILIHIGEHQNIVNLLGACSKSGKLCVILEYCLHGDLLSFLRDKRDVFQPMWKGPEDGLDSVCTYFDLATFAYQIARGMDFLASKKCVHRDLAARNILVSKDHNDAYVIKVADFGMSRDIYRDGIYVKKSSGVLPLKWTAPESIADAIYTSQSDVWSYGIVLWEIFTLGGSPYPGVSTDEFLGLLKCNKKMEQPDSCPDEFYRLMRDCWEEEPDMRPVFAKIYERIRNIIEEFADVNAAYLRLESVASYESEKQSSNECRNSDAYINGTVDSTDTVTVSIGSCDAKNRSNEHGYENLVKLKSLNEGPSEYIDMLHGEQVDESDNLFQSEQMDFLL